MTEFEMKLSVEWDRLDDCHDSRPELSECSTGRALTYDSSEGTRAAADGRASQKRNLAESNDQTTVSRKKRRVVQRTYSSQKIVGARCYARWTRKLFYWGKITKITGCSSKREFSVSAAFAGSQ